jgi:hypothetical protein
MQKKEDLSLAIVIINVHLPNEGKRTQTMQKNEDLSLAIVIINVHLPNEGKRTQTMQKNEDLSLAIVIINDHLPYLMRGRGPRPCSGFESGYCHH